MNIPSLPMQNGASSIDHLFVNRCIMPDIHENVLIGQEILQMHWHRTAKILQQET